MNRRVDCSHCFFQGMSPNPFIANSAILWRRRARSCLLISLIVRSPRWTRGIALASANRLRELNVPSTGRRWRERHRDSAFQRAETRQRYSWRMVGSIPRQWPRFHRPVSKATRRSHQCVPSRLRDCSLPTVSGRSPTPTASTLSSACGSALHIDQRLSFSIA